MYVCTHSVIKQSDTTLVGVLSKMDKVLGYLYTKIMGLNLAQSMDVFFNVVL
jgi:hypothetical protein